MNGYTDMTNIENSRNCLRRIIHDDQEFSNQSIINVIERFVKTVNLMEETILIPSRLMDRQVGDSNDSIQPQKTSSHHHHHSKKKSSPSKVRDSLVNTDLFNLYNILNSVKVDLMWGRQEENSDSTEVELREQNYDTVEVATVAEVKPAEVFALAPQAPVESKGHVRRPSTVSVASSNSSTSTISDSESEVSCNENDSGIESEEQRNKDKSLEAAKDFRTHLLGLYQSLEQMTEAANYLTARYQSDIGAGSC